LALAISSAIVFWTRFAVPVGAKIATVPVIVAGGGVGVGPGVGVVCVVMVAGVVVEEEPVPAVEAGVTELLFEEEPPPKEGLAQPRAPTESKSAATIAKWRSMHIPP
jgi:hypothetical protein